MTREEFVKSEEFAFGKMQLGLLNMINDYMVAKKIKPKDLAHELGVSKGYISQLLNVTFDHKLSKVANLALSCNKMPILHFVDLDEYVKLDSQDKVLELMPMQRAKAMTYQQGSFSLNQNLISDKTDYIDATRLDDTYENILEDKLLTAIM